MKTIKLANIKVVLLIVLTAAIGILTSRLMTVHALSSIAHDTTPAMPPEAKQIPAALAVPAGNVFLFREFGSGVLSYNCPVTADSAETPTILLRNTPSTTSPIVGIHILNAAGGLVWQALNGSQIVAQPQTKVPAPNPQKDAPWVLLKVQSNMGTGPFSQVTFLQRVFTSGGVPQAPCAQNQTQVLVPFTTQYWFYGPSTTKNTLNKTNNPYAGAQKW